MNPCAPRGADAIRRDIGRIARTLEDAAGAADAGSPIDLSGLDERVAALCGEARVLPAGVARGLLADLQTLLSTLDRLTAALARQRDTLAAAAEGRPDPHTVRQRAVSAYGRPPPALAVGSVPVPDTPAAPDPESRS